MCEGVSLRGKILISNKTAINTAHWFKLRYPTYTAQDHLPRKWCPPEGWAILHQLKLKTVPQGHVPWVNLIWTIRHLRLLSQAAQGCFKLIIKAN